MGPKSYSEILFRNPIPKSRNPIPKSYSEILFRNPIPKSYSEILFRNSQSLGFRNPIPKSYSEILFRNPIPKSYSEILFRNPSLQDLGTGMGGTSGSATCLARNAHFTTRICHPKSSPQFPNPIPKSYSEILYSEILFRNPIPKSYSEILFRNPIPKPQSLGFRHRNGGGTQDRPPA